MRWRKVNSSMRLLREHAMHQLHASGALAYRGSHPLDAPLTHITYGEDTGQAGFQVVRRPLQRPFRLLERALIDVGARTNETLFGQGHAFLQPTGVGSSASHQENIADLPSLTLRPALPSHLFQVTV